MQRVMALAVLLLGLGTPARASDPAAEHYRTGARLLRQSKWTFAGRSVPGRKESAQKAVAEFREAARLRPADAGTHHALGKATMNLRSYGGSGLRDAAVAAFQEAVRLRPNSAPLRLDLAGAFMLPSSPASGEGLPDFVQAEVHIREAIRLQPGWAEAYWNLASRFEREFIDKHHVYPRGEALDATIEAVRTAVSLEPRSARAHSELAWRLDVRGLGEEALVEYRRAVTLAPREASYRLSLFEELLETGQTDAAVRELRKAIRLDPDSARAHQALGNLLFEKGQNRKALGEYRKSVRLCRDKSDISGVLRNNIGRALYRVGRKAEARATWRALASSTDPRMDVWAREAKGLLAKYP